MVVGVKPNETRVGGCVSLVEVTLMVVGKPFSVRSLVLRISVLPAASSTTAEVRVQVPASLSFGNTKPAALVTLVDGVTVAVALCELTPEGLTRVNSSDCTPDLLSVAVKLAIRLAAAEVVLMEVGENDNALKFGGTVSVAELTCRVVGKPRAAMSLVLRTSVLPALSRRKISATVQVPALLRAGNVRFTEPLTESAGANCLVPRWTKTPVGSMNENSMYSTPEELSVALRFTVTVAGPVAVLIEFGVKLNAARFGGVVS